MAWCEYAASCSDLINRESSQTLPETFSYVYYSSFLWSLHRVRGILSKGMWIDVILGENVYHSNHVVVTVVVVVVMIPPSAAKQSQLSLTHSFRLLSLQMINFMLWPSRIGHKDFDSLLIRMRELRIYKTNAFAFFLLFFFLSIFRCWCGLINVFLIFRGLYHKFPSAKSEQWSEAFRMEISRWLSFFVFIQSSYHIILCVVCILPIYNTYMYCICIRKIIWFNLYPFFGISFLSPKTIRKEWNEWMICINV